MQLVIGNKNYSSWSLRPWLLLKHYELPFEEIAISLFSAGYKEELAKHSPTLKVPVLKDGDITIWDSLAICEYLSEKFLQGKAYPVDVEERGLCRSYCNEMHSGFMAIRSEMPMNCRARRSLQISDAAREECKRVDKLFVEARERFAGRGEYLFGDFSIADCMFAPLVMRFTTYGVELSETSQKYLSVMLKNPALAAWINDARNDTKILSDFELGEEINP